MIDRDHALPVRRQAELLGVSRSGLYYTRQAVSAEDLALMRRLDELHMAHPFMGARMLRDTLRLEGTSIGRKHVSTLMRKMGIQTLYRAPNTSRKHPDHRIYPYLLRDITIDRPNHVWALDITYIPMAKGFVYLVAVVDWASRRVLEHEVSISMESDFCVRAVERAIARLGRPEIVNTDQGSQFTSHAFVGPLKSAGIQISMDGKGAWRDNVFVERLWRSVKYEEVYLHAYDSAPLARAALAKYFTFYNQRRPHSSLDGATPDQFYFARLPQAGQAA